jgi:DNA-binding transcriptional ArsR family regulator
MPSITNYALDRKNPARRRRPQPAPHPAASAGEELSVAELQEILVMGQSTISTHLSQLKQAGLVEDRRAGKSSFTA